MNKLDEIAAKIHENAKNKGFWDKNGPEVFPIFYISQLGLVHSEVSETIEAIRKDMGHYQVVEEMADTIIRLLDLWAGMVEDGYTNASIHEVLLEKMRKNVDRPRMHGRLA